MTAVFIDSNGIKRNFLWQYDKGQTLVLENLEYEISPEVHFSTSSSKEALIAIGDFQNGTLQVNVPDALLLEAKKITVYLYINGVLTGETVKTLDIFVRPRKKPNDYILSDGHYIVDTTSVENAINNYISNNMGIVEDIVVDYTTVHLTDDVTKEIYDVGVYSGKLYIAPEGTEIAIRNADIIDF